MKYSSALQRLLDILERADTLAKEEEKTFSASSVILSAMDYESEGQYRDHAEGIFHFLGIVNDAIEEANKIENARDSMKYKFTNLLGELIRWVNSFDWVMLRNTLEDESYWTSLELLCERYSREFPVYPYVEEELLDKIKANFNEILDEIENSNLSKELKYFFANKIKELLKAIRRYKVDGSEGLKRITQEIISDTILFESTIEPEDRKKPIFKKILSQVGILNRVLGLGSIASIVGFAVDMETLIPKFTNYLENPNNIDVIIFKQNLSISEIIQESVRQFENYEQHILEGKAEPKALLPGSDDFKE